MPPILDLFGDEGPTVFKGTGYAAPPGTGPKGETCKSCRHYRIVMGKGRDYRKCSLMARVWTGGPGTDIKASAPACAKWEGRPSAHAA